MLDLTRLRADIPAYDNVTWPTPVFLDSAGSSLPPRPVLDAVTGHLRRETEIGGYRAANERLDDLESVKTAIGTLVNADPAGIALSDSATRAWSDFFYAVPLAPGDRILISEADYASNAIAALQRAQATGAVVERIPSDEFGQLDLDALAAMLDERVKLVSLVHAPTNGGLVNPVAEAARIAHRVGALVLCQSYRNPALVAKMAANLQVASGGRFVLGLGAGWKEDEYEAYGYAFPDTRTRLEQLEEAAIIMKAMWSSTPATFVGRHYSVHDAYCVPRPEPAIPLLIGGGGEERTLAVVARRADWWNFNSCTVEEYAHKVAVLKRHCEQVGRNPAEIKLTYLSTASVSEKPDEVVRSPQKHFVAGSSAEVIAELERFCEVGVTHFMFRFLDPESLERFVGTVVPHFG